MSGEQVAAAVEGGGDDLFDEQEREVLAYAEHLAKTAQVDDAAARALQQSLSPRQLAELAGTVALAAFTNRFNHGLGIELP